MFLFLLYHERAFFSIGNRKTVNFLRYAQKERVFAKGLCEHPFPLRKTVFAPNGIAAMLSQKGDSPQNIISSTKKY